MRFNTTSFINEIKQRPALWDTKNSTPDDRHQAWEEIFSIYTDVENIGYEDQSELNSILQRRWKNLRDSYVKFCKRMQTNNDGVAKYIFAKRLNFLDKVISPNTVSRKKLVEKNNEGEKEDEEERAVQNTHKKRKIKIRPDKEDDDDDNDIGIQGPEEINLDEICNGESTFDYNILDNNSMEESSFVQSSNSQYEDRKYYFDPEPHGKDSQAPERDECTVYGELVGVKLRKLNPRTRAYVQHLINNTLFEAEMGKYNKPTAIFFPPSDENN